MEIYIFYRKAHKGKPGGVTISKRRKLPDGDFGITEYIWGNISVWFVDADQFTSDQRQEVFETYMETVKCLY